MELLSLTLQSLDFSDNLSMKQKLPPGTKPESITRTESKDHFRSRRQSKDEFYKSLKSITLDEVAWHDTSDNCWLVIYDYVYDCTEFLDAHPGGAELLLEYAGRDATLAFIGTGHSKMAIQSLERYIIGELPLEERIFRVPGGVQIVGL